MQTILVAGGAGFIGSNLCRKLLELGYKVICADNLITSSKDNIKDLLENPQFTFLEEDITHDLTISEGIDFIFHLASPASPNSKSPRSYINFPIETLMANSRGTNILLDLAKEKNARFLFASTSEVYGDPQINPQPESYFGNVNPNGIRSVYDESKRFGEALSMAYVRKFSIDCRIVRIFNTYGPNMQVDDGRVVSNFINQALKGENLTIYGKGTQTRSFCYIEDMIDGLCALMFTENLKGEVVNLGNPTETTVLEFANVIKRLTGSNSEISFEELPQDDPKKRQPDINKAKKLLNWEPKVTLEEGLTKTIQYFKRI